MQKLCTKKYGTLSLLVLVLFASVPQVTHAGVLSFLGASLSDLVLWVPGYIAAYIVMPLMALLVYLSGMILNWSMEYSVVHMSLHFSETGIDAIWVVIRDLANMFFIFMLIYTALMTMFVRESKWERTIKNIVIAALLINFSLIITKAIIDASNVLSMLFYNAITPGGTGTTTGIGASFMQVLNLQSLYGLYGALNGTKMVIVGVAASVIYLTASFTFLAVAVMFIIRFVALIFVLALSPIYAIGKVLPNASVSGYAKQWEETLINQAFFAPVYFALTWITLKVSEGLLANFTKDPTTGVASGALNYTAAVLGNVSTSTNTAIANPNAAGIFVMFAIIIGMMIASISIAKGMASKAHPAIAALTNKAVSKASGFVYGTAVGGIGRNTLGRFGAANAEDPNLIARGKQSGMAGAAARLELFGAKKLASASFDARRATLPTKSIAEGSGILAGGLVDQTWVHNAVRKAGGTGLGKKMGLDKYEFKADDWDARVHRNVEEHVSDIDMAGRGVKATGVGTGDEKGYKENAADDKKKDREFVKDRVQERTKAEEKVKIQTGAKEAKNKAAGTVYDQAKIDEMVGVLKKLSEDDIKMQKVEVLALQEVAEALSQKQMESIQKSGNYTGPELKSINDARGKRIKDAYAAGPTAGHVPASPANPFGTGYGEAMRLIKRMEPLALAKMGAYDATKPTEPSFNHPDILGVYNKGILGKLARLNEFTPDKMDALRDSIIAEYTRLSGIPGALIPANLSSTYTWLTTGAGVDIYS